MCKISHVNEWITLSTVHDAVYAVYDSMQGMIMTTRCILMLQAGIPVHCSWTCWQSSCKLCILQRSWKTVLMTISLTIHADCAFRRWQWIRPKCWARTLRIVPHHLGRVFHVERRRRKLLNIGLYFVETDEMAHILSICAQFQCNKVNFHPDYDWICLSASLLLAATFHCCQDNPYNRAIMGSFGSVGWRTSASTANIVVHLDRKGILSQVVHSGLVRSNGISWWRAEYYLKKAEDFHAELQCDFERATQTTCTFAKQPLSFSRNKTLQKDT